MIIRLHFVNQGQPLDQRSVTSRSPRVFAAMRNGCAELIIPAIDPGTRGWARRAAVARARPHQPLFEQLEALATLIDSARKEDGAASPRIAEKNAAILSHARELADSVGDATIAMADTGMRRVEHEANAGIDRARVTIRRHPLRSVSLAALAGAIWAGILRR